MSIEKLELISWDEETLILVVSEDDGPEIHNQPVTDVVKQLIFDWSAEPDIPAYVGNIKENDNIEKW